jgi:hypothetical protein
VNQSTPPDEIPPPLPPPQYGLKWLFLLLTGIAVLAAAYHYFGGTGIAAVGLVFAAIAAHVLGNSLGVRLRDSGSRGLAARSKRFVNVQIQFARTTSLSIHRRQGLFALASALSVGILFAVCGALLFSLVYRENISLLAISVGALAFFILGTLSGYIVISFVVEMLHTVKDATKDD